MRHPTPTEVTTIYEFKCSVCGIVARQEYPGPENVKPSWPGGSDNEWMQVGVEAWVCNEHAIVVIVDGKVFFQAAKR